MISQELREQGFRQMCYIRLVEEEITRRYPEGNMKCPTHLSIGQEGVAVGVSMALKENDIVYASHRSHASYLAKGGSLMAMLRELYGKDNGSTQGMGGSMYLYDRNAGYGGSFAIVGDAISVGVGAGLAFQFDRRNGGLKGKAAIIFVGDSVIETGQFWEAINFICTHGLPVMIVMENNEVATSTDIFERQPDRHPYLRLDGFRDFMDIYHCGDDFDSVYRAASWARENLPAFIEVKTHRYFEHVGMAREMPSVISYELDPLVKLNLPGELKSIIFEALRKDIQGRFDEVERE